MARTSSDRLWMQGATRDMDQGALRRSAARRGLIQGSDPLSLSDVQQLIREARESGNTQLLRRAVMAQNMMRAQKG